MFLLGFLFFLGGERTGLCGFCLILVGGVFKFPRGFWWRKDGLISELLHKEFIEEPRILRSCLPRNKLCSRVLVSSQHGRCACSVLGGLFWRLDWQQHAQRDFSIKHCTIKRSALLFIFWWESSKQHVIYYVLDVRVSNKKTNNISCSYMYIYIHYVFLRLITFFYL